MGAIPTDKQDLHPEENPVEEKDTIEVPGPVVARAPPAASKIVKKPPVYSVDNVKIGNVYDVLDKGGRWCEGEIVKIDRENRRVYISYVFWESDFDEWIVDLSERLAPMHFHTYREGGVLRLGQRVEVLDERGDWLESFVVDEKEEEVLIHFKGFAKKFDRWIRRTEATKHIRPFGRAKFHLKKLHDARMRHMLSPNIKWSVRGMSDHRVAPGIPTLSSSSSSAAVDVEGKKGGYFGAYKGEYAGDGGRVIPYTSGKGSASGAVNPRIRCIDDEERERKIADMSDKYLHYVNALQEKDLEVVKVSGDGNCLFRAVAHQIYGDESYHHVVRQKCMDYMESEADFFSQFVVGGREFFHVYIDAKRKDACWGDDPEIEAICELYDRPAEIWAYDPTTGARKLRTFHESAGGLDSFLRTSEVEDWARDDEDDISRTIIDSTHASSRNNTNNRENGLAGMEVVNNNQGNQSCINRSYGTDQHSPRGPSPVSTIQGQVDTQDDDVDPADDIVNNDQRTTSIRGNNSSRNASSALNASRGGSSTRCPVMRLSYYGGGHYDSIIGFDHQRNLIRSKPGDREDQRIRHSRTMAIESARLASLVSAGGAVSSSSSSFSRPSSSSATVATVASGSGFAVTSQRHRLQREEEEVKRREEEAAVLALSRRAAEDKEQEDLETSLFLSMRSQTSQHEDEDGAVLQLVAAESEREYLEHELHSSLLAEAQGALGQSMNDCSAEGTADDDEAALLALAIAQSKEDISFHTLEPSASSSAIGVSPRGDDIDLAMKLSTLSEEEAYNLAIQQSLSGGSQQVAESKDNYEQFERDSAQHTQSLPPNASNRFMEDEDALLQQALAESLRGQPMSYPTNSHHNPGHGNQNQNQQSEGISMDLYGMMDDGEYDEELMRAIQESLRR